MGNIKEMGRVKYIEPTNINNKERVGLGEEISFPYEDYCISVDLTIRIVDRYSCGWGTQTGDIKEYVYSSSDNSLSFLGGSKIGNLEKGANKVWGGLPKDSKEDNLISKNINTITTQFIASEL